MTTQLPISAGELLDDFEDSIRKNTKSALRMIIWLMIYDELAASWTRDFLEEKGVFPKATTKTEKKNQLRKIDRTRQSLEKSVNLPVRAKKGATSDYKKSLIAWKRINPRPTKDELLAGWNPLPLPPAQESGTGHPLSAQNPEINPRQKPPASTQPPETGKVVPNPESPPRQEQPQESDSESPGPDDLVGEEPTVLDEPGRNGRKRVPMPPQYTPEDYLPKPPAPLEIPICGLPPSSGD